MPKFVDLSPYDYLPAGKQPQTYCVGWLAGAEYTRGATSDLFKERLWEFCRASVVQTRGYHVCDLPECAHRTFADGILLVQRGVQTIDLGSAEIRVIGRSGVIYAAPDLIYHYVQAHEYQPPIEFVEAVCDGPAPRDPDYLEVIRKFGMKLRRES